MGLFRTVLCAVDFSDHSAQALRYAAAIASNSQAPLHVVSVIDPLLATSAAIAGPPESLTEQAIGELHGFVRTTLKLSPGDLDPAIHIPIGPTAAEILRTAATIAADLIVLGTHGLGPVRRLVFGSTTHRVLRDAGIAVLAVPLPERRDPHPLESRSPIIVGIDIDQRARTHVDTALALGRDLRSPVIFAHVVVPIQTMEPWRGHARRAEPALGERARAALDALREEAARDVDVRTIVECGDPSSILARIAGDEQAALIVVGLGNPQALGRRPGVTAYRTVCASGVPVLAVPDRG